MTTSTTFEITLKYDSGMLPQELFENNILVALNNGILKMEPFNKFLLEINTEFKK